MQMVRMLLFLLFRHSQKDHETEDYVLQLIGEAKYKLVFGRQQGTFWMQNSKPCYGVKILR